MAYEVKPWKKPGCDLVLRVDKLSDRETKSREINETYGDSGGLNADYRTVEAVAKISNLLGAYGLNYGEDFIFKTAWLNEIKLDFCDERCKSSAEEILRNEGII